jgi:hypothetical protein
MRERHVLEQLAGDGQLVVLAAGVDPARRMLLRSLSDLLQQRIRPEIAFAAVPVSPPDETVAERRFRKLFFLLQDAWHGMRFVAEDLLLRRPKVLLVSEWRGWRRRHRTDRGWARTDVHLESVWHEGRKRPLRLYYRTDSYHPDVGAMTGGRLAPTYLRHFLFLLAQTSRGFLETRSIQRSWQRLRSNEEFRASLVFDDLPVAEIIVDWLDQWVAESLPTYVRDTRRENHFLRGIRPDVILMTAERERSSCNCIPSSTGRMPTSRRRPVSYVPCASPSGCVSSRPRSKLSSSSAGPSSRHRSWSPATRGWRHRRRTNGSPQSFACGGAGVSRTRRRFLPSPPMPASARKSSNGSTTRSPSGRMPSSSSAFR